MKMDKNLREYSFYATATGIMIYLGIAMIQHIDDILKIISEILGLLSPLIIALVIAYLLKPGVQRIEKTLEWSKLVNNAAYRRTLGIVLMYLFVITAFFA
ncbi:MAG: AI-2E family transporter, partial [Acidaminococcaceae bacterium]